MDGESRGGAPDGWGVWGRSPRWIGSPGEEPLMDEEPRGGAPDGWEVQQRSPRWMGSLGESWMDGESRGGALDGEFRGGALDGWEVWEGAPDGWRVQGRSPGWEVQRKEPQIGGPEPWALVLAPTLTSLGTCIKWLPGAGALLSFPALKFENVVSPPDGGWSLIPASCWLLWLWLP